MTRFENMHRDPVDRYRDALSRGASDAELAALAAKMDPGIVQVMHLCWDAQHDGSDRPRAMFADRLEHDLVSAFAAASSTIPRAHGEWPTSSNGHTAAAPIPPLVYREMAVRRRTWIPLIAAVLVAALLGGLIVRLLANSDPAETLVAAGEPRFETLVEATITGAPDSYTPLAVEHWTFQPGLATLSIPALDGPQWLVADSGPAVMTIDGVAQTAPAGSGVVVPADAELMVGNPGTSVLSLYRGVAASGFAHEDYDRSSITRQTALDTEAHEALPPGTSRVVFERLTLSPGTTLLLEPASGQDWLDIASGKLGITLLGDGLPFNWRSGHEREIADGESLPALVPGTRVSLRNIGDEPLVLLRLRVIPTAAANAIDSSVPRITATAAADQLNVSEGVD